MWKNVPVKNPQPNGDRFIDIVMGRVEGPPPLVEYIVDDVVMQPIVTEMMGREWAPGDGGREQQKAFLDNFIAFWLAMGYDFVRLENCLPFPSLGLEADDPAPASDKKRGWKDQHHGAISTWEDFERYPWPDLEAMDFFAMEYLHENLPDGMGLISCHAGGIFEHVSSILSIEGLCIALCEQPDLVKAVTDKVGERMKAYHRWLLDLDRLVAIFQGDDMGFRTQTLVGPHDIRQYFLPWHKQFAQQAHAHGRPYFLHSCGNLEAVMEDVIEDVDIDAKHSYEDAIIPVQDFQAKYGDRIGVLGGLDINILSGGTPEDVRRQTRFLMDTCGARGRYAIGSGNSVPSYVPVENYLSMIDEALECAAANG